MVNRTYEEYIAQTADERADEIVIRNIVRTPLVRTRGYVRAAVTNARNRFDTLYARIDPATTGRAWTAQEYAIIEYQKKTLTDSTHTLSGLNDQIMELMAMGYTRNGR
jgi:hypothetical protein